MPQREVDCVDRSLRAQHSNLWSVIQRGVDPADSAVARIRNACRAEARHSPPTAHRASQALAESVANPASQLADNTADKAAGDKVAAEKAEVEKAAAAAKAEALKMAAAKATADKAAADKAAAEKMAAEKMAADKAKQLAAEKAAAEKTAAEKAAAEKTAAEKKAAKAAADGKPVAEKPVAAKPATHVASIAPETVDAARAGPDAGASAKVEPPKAAPPSVETKAVAALDPVAFTAAELRTNFVYGLVSGPILFCLGGLVFLFLGRMKSVAAVNPEADVSGRDEDPRELDRQAAAAMVRQARRGRTKPIAPRREQQAGNAKQGLATH